MTSFLVAAVFLLLALPELPGLRHRRDPAEIAAFAFLWAAGLTLSLLIAAHVPMDGVTKLLRAVFEPLGRMLIQPPPA